MGKSHDLSFFFTLALAEVYLTHITLCVVQNPSCARSNSVMKLLLNNQNGFYVQQGSGGPDPQPFQLDF